MMPPLPEKVSLGVGYFDEIIFGHTEAQMTEYGKACYEAGLIAAAPDLLEACQRMVKWAEDWKAGNTHPHDDWLFARAAIAKAIGGTP